MKQYKQYFSEWIGLDSAFTFNLIAFSSKSLNLREDFACSAICMLDDVELYLNIFTSTSEYFVCCFQSFVSNNVNYLLFGLFKDWVDTDISWPICSTAGQLHFT